LRHARGLELPIDGTTVAGRLERVDLDEQRDPSIHSRPPNASAVRPEGLGDIEIGHLAERLLVPVDLALTRAAGRAREPLGVPDHP
jgi:hypothetical protein